MRNTFLILALFFSGLLNATTIKPGLNIKDPQIIGGVYNSKLDFFDPGVRCVEVDEKKDVRSVFNNNSSVNFNETAQGSTLEKEFGFGFGLELKPPSGDTHGFDLEFNNTFLDEKITALSVYKTNVFIGSEILEGPYKLTEEAKKLSEKDFQRICGDEFVTRVNRGAIGEVKVKIQTTNIEEEDSFDSSWSMGLMDIGSFEAALSKLKKTTDSTIKITVSGRQMGGFTARINSIFGLGEGTASCAFDDLKGCTKLFADIVTYFSVKFVEAFDPYFRDSNGSGVITLPSTAAPLKYVTTSYCKLSPENRPPFLKCDDELDNSVQFQFLKGKKREIIEELRNLSEFGNTSKLVLAPDYLQLVKTYTFRMKKDLEFIKDTETTCLRDKWTCESEVRHLSNRLYPLQPEIISFIQNDERIQFCFKSGKKVDISGLEIKTLSDNGPSKTFRLYGPPAQSDWDCFIYKAPELNREEFNGLQIRVKTVGEDQDKCKLRATKKYSSWANWDLKAVKVRHFKSGHSKFFEGKNLRQKMKCKRDSESRYLLNWETLKPRG
jgi:hypothetical protein